MFRSLWFRLTGTVVFVVVVTMLVALVASLVIMRGELETFVNTIVENLQDTEVTVEDPEGVREMPLPEIIDRRFPDINLERNLPNITIRAPKAIQDDTTRFLETMARTSLLAIGLSGGLAILASTWLFWNITRPLAKLRSAAEAIAAGDLQARVPLKSRDEVGRVAKAFNTMASELEQEERLRKRMVADVAHELRTPLSVMRGNLEAMIDDLIPASEVELDAIHQEVMRLARLVEDLRILSLADAGELQLKMQAVDPGALVETAVRRLTATAQAKGVTLSGDIGGDSVSVMGDEGKLQQVLANLIGNAIRHAPEGSQVTVQARPAGNEVQLIVSDQGPGVDPKALPSLFERFWKGDRARVRTIDGGGSGLGLSIVRQLVDLHGGRVEASLPEDGGLQVTVSLPVQDTATS